MSINLLPCPFCGNETPEFERVGSPLQSCIVICGSCGARHESSDEGARCGSSWNQRAEPDQDGLRTSLETALNRIEDMLSDDDGQAFKEARKFLAAARPLTASPTEQDEHKPLFGEMIAQHPGLREEIAAELVEQDERAAFEAAYRARYPVSCDLDPAKFNRSDEGEYEDIRVSIAWAMWQARASKGTK